MATKNVLVIRNPVVEYRPAALGGVGSFTDISKWFSEFSLMPKKAKLDTAGFGSTGKESEKGDAEHQVKFSCFHSRAYTDFSSLMRVEFQAEGNTEFRVKFKNEAVGTDNRQYLVLVKVTDLGNIGGAKNTVAKMDVTYDVEGEIDEFDGTTHITY